MNQITNTAAPEASAAWIENSQALGGGDRGGPVWNDVHDIHSILERFMGAGSALSLSSSEAGRFWQSVEQEGDTLLVTLEGGEKRSLKPTFLTMDHYPNLPVDSLLILGFEITPDAQGGSLDLPELNDRSGLRSVEQTGAVSLGQRSEEASHPETLHVMLCCTGSNWVDLEVDEVRSGVDYVLRRMAREAEVLEAVAA